MLMVTIYKKKNYKIFSSSHSSYYIIWNTRKPFEDGRSHINNYNLAKHIIDLAINRKIPDKKKKYIIESLIRLTDNSNYKNKLESLLEKK